MSLFTVTIIVAIALLVKGFIWFIFPKWTERTWNLFLRSSVAAVIIFGLAGAWFLWNIAHLGEADFGQFKNWLLLIFGAVIVGSFIYLKDFLVVRGISVLQLLIAKFILDVTYMQQAPGRLLLVGLTYVMIVQALYFAALPYKMRNFLNWLSKSPSRIKVFALGFIAYGLLLVVAAFTY